MKDFYERIADRILPKFSKVCQEGKCKHPKCKCGHCQRNYHISKNGGCTKINSDLTTCKCKNFTPST
jgi:hypothetical protein